MRREVPRTLLACWEQAAAILPALQERLAAEPDPQARVALIEAVGALGVRAATGDPGGTDRGAVGAWLMGRGRRPGDPTVRLAALTQLVRCAPAMLPSDVVSTVLGLLGEVYGDGEPPGDIGFVIASMGTLAAELVPRMGQRLRDLPVVNGWDWRRTGLVAALGGLGAAAVPAVPDLVALLRQERLATAAARALGRLGATGAKAVPGLRGLLDHADADTALAAASALWRITRDPAACLLVFRRHLTPGGTSTAAAEGIAELGPAAAPAAGRLRELLFDSSAFVRVHAAAALWRAAGDTGATLPVLLACWEEKVQVRCAVAGYLAQMGPAADAAVPVLRWELAQVRRHNHDIRSSDAIQADEALLRACLEALTRITGSVS